MSNKKKRKLHGRVKKIIQSPLPGEAEKAEICVDEADHLYREIRIENVLSDGDGSKASLKSGAEVDVVVEADPSATTKKPD